MDKFDYLADASFNLLKASEESHAKLSHAINSLENSVNILNDTAINIEKNIADSLKKTSADASHIISRKVLADLGDANDKAIKAAIRYEQSAKFSILKLGSMFFLFFLLAGTLMWYFFIKDIPTIKELNELRRQKEYLESEMIDLKNYGDVGRCDGYPCVQVDLSKKYGESDERSYYIIIPRG